MNQRPFAVFDIDGTIIRWQLYHAIVAQLAENGKMSHSAVDAIEEARQTWHKRSHSESFRTYEHAVVEGYHSAIKDLDIADFEAAVESVFDTYRDQVYTYTRNLIHKLKAEGYLLFAVSGSHQEIVQKLGDHYGFDEVIGAKYIVEDDRYTGERISPIEQGKDSLVRELAERHNATWKGSVAIGDSMSDAAMLALVERPTAFNPNRQLFEEAQKHGWEIVIERKNMTYRLTQKDGTYVLASDNL